MENKLVSLDGELYFGPAQIEGGNVFLPSSVSLDELPVGSLSIPKLRMFGEFPTLFKPADADAIETSDGHLFTVRPMVPLVMVKRSDFWYGRPMLYYYGEHMVEKVYMESSKELGGGLYAQIRCINYAGILEQAGDHFGGLYNGETVAQILEDIMGGIVPYTMDPVLEDIPVYGYLPIRNRRKNLHALLFAEGICVEKNADGDPHFAGQTLQAPIFDAGSRIYIGPSVDNGEQANRVVVTEHAYALSAGDMEEVLHEGTVDNKTLVTPKGRTVIGDIIPFSGPMHDLQVTGSTILESGPNYAVLSPSTQSRLVGKAYTHTTRLVYRDKQGAARNMVESKDREVSVTGNTLISIVNSENVADRMMAYWGTARTFKGDLKVTDQYPGDRIALPDPFPHDIPSILQSLDITMSDVLRATAEIVTGYMPTQPGNNYKHFVILTGSGTFTVPQDAGGRILAVLIESGQGGEGGVDGIAARWSSIWDGSSRFIYKGHGGAPGLGGDPGRVAQFTMLVSPGQRIAYNCGTPGIGGAHTAVGGQVHVGTPGSAVTFGPHNSSGGIRPVDGWVNPMSGEVYARKGKPGVKGGSGTGANEQRTAFEYAESVVYNGVTFVPGATGENFVWENGISGVWAQGDGGWGGGPAAGHNGGPGGVGYFDGYPNWTIHGGPGGKGADAVAPDAAVGYGNGGDGGNGGGGGSAGGPASVSHPDDFSSAQGSPGAGGLGSKGGDGAPGCIFVFY